MENHRFRFSDIINKLSFLSTILLLVFLLTNQTVFGQEGNVTIEQRLETPTLHKEYGLVICTRQIELLAETNVEDFEKWVAASWNEAWRYLIPEIQSFISKNNSCEQGNI